jgi:hypothetical protein
MLFPTSTTAKYSERSMCTSAAMTARSADETRLHSRMANLHTYIKLDGVDAGTLRTSAQNA